MLNYTIYEDGSGGQKLFRNNDIATTESLNTLAYLLMFSGNVEADTVKENNPANLRLDWWGNDPAKNSDTWVNSRTERTLAGLALNTAAIFKVEEAVKADLKSLEQYGTVDVTVTLPSLNNLSILVQITQPDMADSVSLQLIWDASRNEIILRQ